MTQPKDVKFRITDVAGKGRGAVATSRICKGELVLVDEPVLTYRPDDDAIRQFGSRDRMVEDSQFMAAWSKELELQLASRSTSEQAAAWELVDVYADQGKTLAGIFLTNSYPVGEDGAAGLFTMMSRFNHSCNFNVHHSQRDWAGCSRDERESSNKAWDDAEVLYATRDIEVGEELSLSYLDYEELCAPREQRQTRLLSKMGFHCSCDVCSLNGQARMRSDENRLRMQVLDDLLPEVDDLVPHGHPLVEDILRLIEEEFGGSPVAKARFYHDVFQLARESGLMEMAQDMANKAWQNSAIAHGSNSPVTLDMKRYADNPAVIDSEDEDD